MGDAKSILTTFDRVVFLKGIRMVARNRSFTSVEEFLDEYGIAASQEMIASINATLDQGKEVWMVHDDGSGPVLLLLTDNSRTISLN